MIALKRLTCLALLPILLLSFLIPPATVSALTPIKITEIQINKFSINSIRLLMRGESSASLSISLTENINFYREGENFPEKDVGFSIRYETEAFDTTYRNKTGLFFLQASIVLEDPRYILAPDVSTGFTIPVFLYDPAKPSSLPPLDPELNHYDDMEAFHIVAPVQTDLQQVTDTLIKEYPYKRFYLYFDNGYYLTLPNHWNMNSVKTGTPGIYKANRRPRLPRGVLMDQIPEIACSINIQDPKTFTLSSPRSFGNNIVTTWLYPTPDKSRIRTWYRIGKGHWTEDRSEYLMSLHSGDNGKHSLYLQPWEMKKDIRYQFRLEYDGVYSDILEICVNKDGFYIPNEGDRDGGDRDNQTPPDVTQAPPEASSDGNSTGTGSDGQKGNGTGHPKQSDQSFTDDSAAAISGQGGNAGQKTSTKPGAGAKTPSPKQSAATEADTATGTTWSGIRVQNYLKAFPGLPLLFEKNNIRVAIPADSPALLSVSDTDFLHVEIQGMTTDTIRLAVSLNDTPLNQLPLTITMPWAKDSISGKLRIKNRTGELIGNGVASNQEGFITFTVSQPGIYTVVPSAPEETPVPDQTASSSSVDNATALLFQTQGGTLAVTALFFSLILGGISIIIFRVHKRKEE